MVKLKEIPKAATFAWSPEAIPLIATGTVAGTIDSDFSSNSSLDIWDLGLTDRSPDSFRLTKPLVSVPGSDRYYAVEWSKPTLGFSRGVIAGARENGEIEFWDAAKLLAKGPTQGLIGREIKHTGPVKAIQFNPGKPQLLASAGPKSEVFIWDLENLAAPIVPGPSARSDEMESVAWNLNVANILATGGSSGHTSIWDLRHKREVLHLQYSAIKGAGVSSIAWHPDNSTKLVTASDSDAHPVVLLWDLRNGNAPEKVLSGHENGILSLDWCVKDSTFLLSSGKDNKTILWDTHRGEMLGEYPVAANWSFQTRFNPVNPDLFATASFDGKICIETLQNTSVSEPKPAANISETDFWNSPSFADTQAAAFRLTKVPKWLPNPCAVSFGFGGKIVIVKSDMKDRKSVVKIEKFVEDASITGDLQQLSAALKGGSLPKLVEQRLERAASDAKADWEMLQKLLSHGPKEALKLYAGIVEPKAEAETEKTQEEKTAKALDDIFGKDTDGEDTGKETGETRKETDGEADDGDDFFGKVAAKAENAAVVVSTPIRFFPPGQDNTEKEIIECLLQKQFSRGVELLMQQNRLLDASVFAMLASEAEQRKVQEAYFRENAEKSDFARLLYTVSRHDLTELVEKADLSEWRSIVTGLATYGSPEDFRRNVAELGDRLLAANAETARNDAVACYFAAGDLEKLTALWIRELPQMEDSLLAAPDRNVNSRAAAHFEALQEFVEKVLVFREAAAKNFDNSHLDSLNELFREYGNIVASQGELELASAVFDLLPEQMSGLSLEKERVWKAEAKPVKTQAKPELRSGAATGTTRYGPRHGSAFERQNATSFHNMYAPPPASVSTPAPHVPPAPHNAGNPFAQPPAAIPTAQTAQLAPPGPPGPPGPPAPPTGSARRASNINNPYAPPAAAATAPAAQQYAPPPSGAAPRPVEHVGKGFNIPGPRPVIATSPVASAAPGSPATAPPPPGAAKPKSDAGWNDLPSQLPPSASRRSAAAPARVNTYEPPAAAMPRAPLQQAGAPFPPPAAGPPGRTAGEIPRQGTAPPLNPYAQEPPTVVPPAIPRPQSSQSIIPPRPGGAQTPLQPAVPPPPPANPYAPQGAAYRAAVSPGTVPAGMAQYGVASSPVAPPVAPPTSSFAAPPVASQTSSFAAPPTPPTPATPPAAPKPRYPSGDRSHIPTAAQPIVQILEQQVAHVRPKIPQTYAKHLADVEKRLNILFDHLNNDDLSSELVRDLVELCQSLAAGDYAKALELHIQIVVNRSNETGHWMVGIKRLIEMARATSQ